jgi:hypothetical protein
VDPDTLNRMIREYREVTASTVKRAKKTLKKAGSTAQAMAAIEAKGRHQEPSPESKPRSPHILYLSRTLRSNDKNYTFLELELGAVVSSVLKLQRYLDGPRRRAKSCRSHCRHDRA